MPCLNYQLNGLKPDNAYRWDSGRASESTKLGLNRQKVLQGFSQERLSFRTAIPFWYPKYDISPKKEMNSSN
jgi:hypothetical protein